MRGHSKRLRTVLGVAGASMMLCASAIGGLAKPDFALPGSGCENRLSALYLAGSFVMPGTSQKMGLWVGKRNASDANVIGLVGGVGDKSKDCEAKCVVLRFERFTTNGKPALLELDCEGTRIRTMRMPLHVQWVSNKRAPVVRLGSSLFGMEQAPLKIEVNRYSVATK